MLSEALSEGICGTTPRPFFPQPIPIDGVVDRISSLLGQYRYTRRTRVNTEQVKDLSAVESSKEQVNSPAALATC